ncbi:ATP-binding cassette subfamily B protein IrtA [Stackebrandtia endophytica]|uniref:Mycobactin import ATP-binding/permease protein IrtA n=1 Tax=Stackebrandtia endophytica TaxID=1496996 RepID=A0A543AR82_9ACTN|nr:ATP-binding cassette domain-containing protein [Stackebrandtia endophytica]TQL75074.1 ATP-binding cassette subfamily B protein IrtA [Stackebrandtia endophytica]
MARGYSGAVLKALGAGDHLLTVVSINDITAHYRRITFDAPDLFDTPFEPGAYLRLWIPDPTRPGKEHQRGYTVVDPDPELGRISLEFAMHDAGGPAMVWAANAEPGTEIAATRYGSTRFAVSDPVPDGYLLIGDPCAIPAINSVISVLPDDVPVEVLVEHAHDDDRSLPITDHPRLTVTWVPTSGASTLLADSIDERDWSNWYAWVTTESAATRRVRERLKDFGFPRGEVHAQAYWIKGRAMGRDREETPKAATPPPQSEATPKKPRGRWRSRSGTELLAPLKGRLILAGLLQAVVSLLQLAPYVVLAELARRVLAGESSGSALIELGLTAVVLFGAATGLAFALIAAMHVVDARFGHRVRVSIVDKLSRLPLGWFTERASGRVKQAVQDDSASLHYLVTHAVLDVVAAVVTPVAVLVYLFTVDAGLAALLLVPLVVFGILTARMVQDSTAAIPQSVEWTGRVSAEAVAYFDGLPVVRAYDLGERGAFRSTLHDHARFLETWQRPFVGRKAVIELVTRPMTSLLLITAAGMGIIAVGGMTAVDLIPFLLLGVTFSGQMLAIGYGLTSVREATLAARRIGLLLVEPELASPPNHRLPAANGRGRSVRFDNVSFGYQASHTVVDGIDLELRQDTVTALVGPSGAGKSTMAALLARFHDVTDGVITIDGVDIATLDTEELYRTVGFVFQKVSIVAGTVAENIALARPDADRADIEAAARAAQIHERILALPRGYDTDLGSTVTLSGGEAQRLQIARAILADPQILVLDEATAFADPESEYHVQRALSNLVTGRTVLVIAHRLHTIVDADTIVVLDNGRISQRGSHRELLTVEGRYRELWNSAAPTSTSTEVPA